MTIVDVSYDNATTGKRVEKWQVAKSEKDRLGMSRAFGDFVYKKSEVENLTLWEQAVVSRPTVVSEERCERDRWLILACDGIWDEMSNDEVGTFVDAEYNKIASASTASPSLSAGEILAQVCDELCRECLKKGSEDNMTAMIVKLDGNVVTEGRGRRSGAGEGEEEAVENAVRKLDMNA